MATLADGLKEIRKECNVQQKDIAEELGSADNTISRWERGENSPDDEQVELMIPTVGHTQLFTGKMNKWKMYL